MLCRLHVSDVPGSLSSLWSIIPVASAAASNFLSAAVRSGRADLVKLLVSQGSGVNLEGCHGRRPLHEAAKLGDLGLVRLLLEAGAQPDPRASAGCACAPPPS
uniref:Uncharacterized protein n=1 Tax=Oryzias latipes TaxID=8090 RepID=A0A3B3H7Z3_ORYLA